MGSKTLHTILLVSALLGLLTGLLLLIIGLRLAGLTFQYGWETALNDIRLSRVPLEHYRINEAGEEVIDPEVEREFEEGFNIVVMTLAVLSVGSFFCFRWAKAEIARTRGSPPAKD